MNINPIFLKDMYKIGHHRQYPSGTSLIFTNWTPRKSRIAGINHSVFFGLKYLIKEYLQDSFQHFFFKNDPYAISIGYQYVVDQALGQQPDAAHIEALCKLGYLPIAIHALPEGSVVPCGVPAMVLYNTHPDFYWVPNMLETLMSCTLWGACTSATIARQYRLILNRFAGLTSDIPEFVDYQAHDFSMRGMYGVEASVISGMAHLQYFKGTDTLPAYLARHNYYESELHVASVNATEHSVMSAGGKENEMETYRRLITDVYPDGIISIVSDTWSLWNVIEKILPALKEQILNREGTVVIRPDSGNPADILCGNPNKNGLEGMGVVESLWEIFGGSTNSKGYKQLDHHIGVIYGDGITLERCAEICERLAAKGFASTNVVFGIGSWSYQYHTRDTFGWAMKSTYCEIDGVGRAITKDPVTDDGTKKSHSGLLKVVKSGEAYQVLQDQTWESFRQDDNELKLVFEDGVCK